MRHTDILWWIKELSCVISIFFPTMFGLYMYIYVYMLFKRLSMVDWFTFSKSKITHIFIYCLIYVVRILMVQIFHSNTSVFRWNLGQNTPIITYILLLRNIILWSVSVNVWEYLAQERTVIGSMWVYQQVIMCIDGVVMW